MKKNNLGKKITSVAVTALVAASVTAPSGFAIESGDDVNNLPQQSSYEIAKAINSQPPVFVSADLIPASGYGPFAKPAYYKVSFDKSFGEKAIEEYLNKATVTVNGESVKTETEATSVEFGGARCDLKINESDVIDGRNTVVVTAPGYEQLVFSIQVGDVILNAPEVAETVFADKSDSIIPMDSYWAVSFKTDGDIDEDYIAKYLEEVDTVTVNGEEVSKKTANYAVENLYGGKYVYLHLNENAFKPSENTVVLTAEGYEDLQFTIEVILNAPEVAEAVFADKSDSIIPMDSYWAVSFKADGDIDEDYIAKYLEEVDTVTVNGEEASKKTANYAVENIYGGKYVYLHLNENAFKPGENTVVLTAEGYEDLQFTIDVILNAPEFNAPEYIQGETTGESVYEFTPVLTDEYTAEMVENFFNALESPRTRSASVEKMGTLNGETVQVTVTAGDQANVQVKGLDVVTGENTLSLNAEGYEELVIAFDATSEADRVNAMKDDAVANLSLETIPNYLALADVDEVQTAVKGAVLGIDESIDADNLDGSEPYALIENAQQEGRDQVEKAVVEAFDALKAQRVAEIAAVVLTEEDVANKTPESITAANNKLDEQKSAATQAVQDAQTVEELDAIATPTTKEAKALLVDIEKEDSGTDTSAEIKDNEDSKASAAADDKEKASAEKDKSAAASDENRSDKIAATGDTLTGPMSAMGLLGLSSLFAASIFRRRIQE